MTLPLRYTQVSSHSLSSSSNDAGKRRTLPSVQALILRLLPCCFNGSYSIAFLAERGKMGLNRADLPINSLESISSLVSFISDGSLGKSGRDFARGCRAALLLESAVKL